MTRMPLYACVWIPAVLLALVVSTASGDAVAQPPRSVQMLIDDLRSPNRRTRQKAAKELGEERHPNIYAVGPLLAAAKRETHKGALADMLLVLGKSGMMEPLGLIQTHAQSPIKHIAHHARRALKMWLVTNGVLGPDDEMPDPPHAYYREPPPFPPHAPAGRPLGVWAGKEPPLGPDNVPRRPMYEGANPDGVPPGYQISGEPKWPLVWGGLGTFGGLYLITNVAFGVGAASDNDEYDARVLIPIVGPLFPAADLFEATGFLAGLSHMVGVFLVIDTLGQLTGAILLLAGAVSERPVLEHKPPGPTVDLQVTPTGAALVGSF